MSTAAPKGLQRKGSLAGQDLPPPLPAPPMTLPRLPWAEASLRWLGVSCALKTVRPGSKLGPQGRAAGGRGGMQAGSPSPSPSLGHPGSLTPASGLGSSAGAGPAPLGLVGLGRSSHT